MFEELKQFILDMEFDRVAVFLYSDEEGTSAVDLDRKVDLAVMEERRNELLALQESISEAKNRAYLGRTMEVLVDGISEESDRLLECRHEGLAPEIDGVVFCDRSAGKPGEFVSVTVTDVAGYDLIAQPVVPGRRADCCARCSDSPHAQEIRGRLPISLRSPVACPALFGRA
jgi:ribosomal protein S12 methylthiotransferase